MRIGTAIVPVFTRPPGLIAMQAAALAELAPGRFVLGLGSSTPVVIESWMGVPFQRPLTRTRDAVVAVRALLAGEKVGGMRLAVPPSTPPPIWMGALGDRMLRAAGELADGVCFYMCGPGIIPRLLEKTGRRMDSVARLMVLPGDDAMPAARRLVVTYALVPYYARVIAEQGFGEEVAAIQRAWQSGERAAAPGQVSDAMIRELVLTGAPDEIRAGLERYSKAGLGAAALAVAPLGPADERAAALIGLLERLR
jgi:alkanesulfonate monooxygenase SsuD/methylene tetrahydromethanopterin reductase-like flavin-dependent oxidoreductase (luciferase family)